MSAEREVYLFFSRFPPPFGGVSNQVKLLAEYLIHQADSPVRVIVVDLKTLKLHRLDSREWSSVSIFKTLRFYLAIFLAIPLCLSFIFSMKKIIFPISKFFWWRTALVATGCVLSRFLDREAIRLIYSFHIGAPSLVGGVIAEIKNAPHITAVFGESFSNFDKLKTQAQLLERTAGEIVSCSDHCGKMLGHVFPNLTYSVLYYGGDLIELAGMRSRVGLRGLRNRVMFLGRFDEEMGVDFFLELIKSLDDICPDEFEFVMCGQDGKATNAIQRFTREFTGKLTVEISATFARRNELLVNSDFLIVPSTNARACFGLAIVEGIAAGCTVYARDVGGHIEPFLNNEEFLFDRNYCPRQLAEDIRKLQFDDNLAERRESLRHDVIQKFDVSSCLATQLVFIDSFLGKKITNR